MPVAWNEDPPASEGRLAANARTLVLDLVAAAGRRDPPTVVMARDWHRRIYAGIGAPVGYYVGEVRDSDPAFPELSGYEVRVGSFPGVPSGAVPQELATFESRAQTAVAALDPVIASGARPVENRELQAVLVLCAILHGEWVRIHPFANGNGRTARIWATWAALRYGLPPFVRVKPRPAGDAYAAAARASMQGEHRPTVAVLAQMLSARLRNGP